MPPIRPPGLAAWPAVTIASWALCAACGAPVSQAATGRPRRYCPGPACQRAAATARKRASRARQGAPVASVVFGSNADLIKAVASLYLTPGMVVADVTYSTGRFWSRTDTSRRRFLASDLHPATQARPVLAADFRALPYRDDSIDVVVLDPPYMHAPGRALMRDRYSGRQTAPLATQAGIMGLYREGLAEAARVLHDGGQCWVKVGDSLASEKQRWNHISVHQIATGLGYYPRDLLLLVPPAPMPLAAGGRWGRQLHARKVATYLWVLDSGGYQRRG